MVRLEFSIDLNYEIASAPADFIFLFHAAQNDAQLVVAERLDFSQSVSPEIYIDRRNCGTRLLRVQANPGPFSVHYDACVDIVHYVDEPQDIGEVPIAALPVDVLPYLYPSRYCQSDRLIKVATREFGHLSPGYQRVEAIQTWVRQRIKFMIGTSDLNTSAIDTLVNMVGVCRDFSHLMIALCRALNIPARFVTGLDYGADISLGPPDFHAYVEVFLGQRWYLFDPTGISPLMGLVRLATGRDAADVSFATIFGNVKPATPLVKISALSDPDRGVALPQHTTDAISSHAPMLV